MDLVLDALALRVAEGYAAAAVTMRSALTRISTQLVRREG
jgi:hypothetical protein